MLKRRLDKEIVQNVLKTMFLALFAAAFMIIVSGTYVSANPVCSDQVNITGKNTQSAMAKMALIDKYQKQYFEIIKRNNFLLGCEDVNKADKDSKELKNLFAQVEKQITNKKYLKDYKKIQKRYSQCDEITTPAINEFAYKNYKAVDGLLNKVYRKAEANLIYEDAKKLAINENEWEKSVEDYKKIYDSMEFGTIGTSIYYNYEINMREFRTLLLMLYL